MKTLIKGALLGGLIVFFWETISWTALPFHEKSFKEFQDRVSVQNVLMSNAPEKGLYLLSYENLENQGLTAEQKQEKMKQQYEQMEKGPFALLVMNPEGTGAMPAAILFSLLLQITGALLVTWLLMKANIASYGGRLAFVTVFGVTAGLLGHMPDWIWWKFPCDYVGLKIADMAVDWFLAGLVLAKIVSVKPDHI
jgi:hypothetical protein